MNLLISYVTQTHSVYLCLLLNQLSKQQVVMELQDIRERESTKEGRGVTRTSMRTFCDTVTMHLDNGGSHPNLQSQPLSCEKDVTWNTCGNCVSFIWDRVSCIQNWLQTTCLDKDDPELLILLLVPAEFWDYRLYRHVPLYLAYVAWQARALGFVHVRWILYQLSHIPSSLSVLFLTVITSWGWSL